MTILGKVLSTEPQLGSIIRSLHTTRKQPFAPARKLPPGVGARRSGIP